MSEMWKGFQWGVGKEAEAEAEVVEAEVVDE